MNKPLIVSLFASVVTVSGIYSASARPEYATKENKPCGYCHLSSAGGGARGFRGAFYGANNLSFDKFDETREAAIAGVDPNLSDAATRPKVAYAGNVTGPKGAAAQIASMALRTPVLVVFFNGSSDNEKAAAKELKKVALAYGRKVAVVGVLHGSFDTALQLTSELGSQIRVFGEEKPAAAEKYGAANGLDLVAVSKMGETVKLYSGYSQGNLTAAIAQIGTYGVEAPTGLDLSDAPSTAVNSGPLK